MPKFKVTAKSGLRLRSSPNGSIITAMPYGTVVSGDGQQQSGWHHVNYNGTWGWSYGQYLQTIEEQKKTVVKIAAKKSTKKKSTKAVKKKIKKAKAASKKAQKKKAEEQKKRAKSKGKLGAWGTKIVFQVSQKKMLLAKDIKVTQEGRWNSHDILQKVPRSEFMGPSARQVTLTLVLSAEHGVKPRKIINTIEKAVRTGEVEYLVIGGKIIGSHKMAIASISEAWETVYNKGELVRASVDVTFSEYA